MDSRNRLLLIAAVVGLALAAPYLMAPEPAAPKPPAVAATPKPAAPAATDPAQPARRTLTAAEEAERAKAQRLLRLQADGFEATVTDRNAGLVELHLKSTRFRGEAGKALDLVTTERESYLPLAVDVEGWPSDPTTKLSVVSESPRELVLAQEADGLRVTRRLHPGKGPYQLWVTTLVQNIGDASRSVRLRIGTHHYVSREAEGANIPLPGVRSSQTSNGVTYGRGEIERGDRSVLLEPHVYAAPIEFCAVEDLYFLKAVAPEGKDKLEGCTLVASDRGRDAEGEALGSLFSARLAYAPVQLAPGESHTFQQLAYLGPKNPDTLAAAGHSLKNAIDSGWFTSLAEGLTWLLRWLFDHVGNWGIAIILLTFVVKLVLLPLTMKQMQSMARMKELKPELDHLTELYGDDREKKGAAIMELYRKRGVNPMAGCFPVLLQLPIWFSLYASLSSNVELFHAPFALWWTDLSSPDRYFVLPLALGVLMFVQQKMTPASGMDPVQQKMMLYMMPSMMTAFMLFLPAGLCLYMFTNSALSILQQRAIETHLKNKPPSSKADPSATAPATPSALPSSQSQAATPSPSSPSQLRPKSSRPKKAQRR
jgi:YidC/Oxa1 family membrane protein insertase